MLKTLTLSFALFVMTSGFATQASAFSPDSLVWKKCADCHAPVNGVIPRVEEIRTTPEEWTVIVDRMARLYKMELNKGEMDTLLKELTTTQILTPAELGKVAYLNLLNNPQTMEVPVGPDEQKLYKTCVRCHSYGKINSYRMNPASWAKVRDFHLYMYPTVVYQMREMRWNKEADSVLAYLAKVNPYGQAWQVPSAKPASAWQILGYEAGKGNYSGQASLTASGNDEYAVQGEIVYDDGTIESFKGEATLYGGYALRTRTSHNGLKTLGAYSLVDGKLQGEHHFPAPDFRTSTSTWYPADGKPQLLKVTPAFLLKGETTKLVLEGINLPDVVAADIQFSGGSVKVKAVKRLSAEAIEVQVASAKDGLAKATVGIKGLNTLPLVLAKQIDYIALTPEMGRARLNGNKFFPAEGVQYQAIAFAKTGKASKPADDVRLGPVPATFKLAALIKRKNDDDLQYMGMIHANGKYIPHGDFNSIPTRAQQVEATGLSRVEASYQHGKRQYAAKGKLVVTLPDYIPRIR
ncbi:MAG: quinohemoprotein amine dehydrogenase subunit alpha [Proteobacteria bacterium]|nr:quinohemoprotein amine dehydrogenase subunit alpha [Pseudomonadota bacterium]